MFWTIAGLLSGAALHFATLMQKSSRTQRARWMGILCLLWLANAAFGSLWFVLVELEVALAVSTWRVVLPISAFFYCGLVAAYLVVNRKASLDEVPKNSSWMVALSLMGYLIIFGTWMYRVILHT